MEYEEPKKRDRRAVRTDRAILHALLSLTKRKKLEEISVSAVCEEADISRQAFYTRFRDPVHAVESYVDSIYEEGVSLAVPYETSAQRKQKLHDLWENNMPVLKLILVSSQSQHIYDYFIEMVAKLYMELNRVPRSDVAATEPDEMQYAFELNLATLHAKMLKQRIETGSDGTYEDRLMAHFFENISKIGRRST